ncbi:TIGR04283 family arsenosugar biosynthesis glycosyltransferase [soil metagenome]
MISVIIPVYNEEHVIKKTIRHLWQSDQQNLVEEIIVIDGGSTDNTITAAKSEGVHVFLSKKGRAEQMNYGASLAKGKILYFLHADTLPPATYTSDIQEAVKNKFDAGCYRLSFDFEHWFLKANCWFTRFDFNAFRFGDQSLFVKKETFLKTGGFSEKHIVMEDQHLIVRLKKTNSFTIIPKEVTSSGRKYVTNGIYKTQFTYYLIYFMYKMGYSQKQLVDTYKRFIQQDKL